MTTSSTIFGYNDGTTTVAADDHAYATCTESNTLSYEPKSEARKCVSNAIDGGGKPSTTGSEVGGDLTLGANYEDIGLAFKSVLGNPVTVAAGALFTHTFDTTKTELPFMWFQHKRVDGADTLNEQYTGILANTLEVKIEADGLNSPTLGLVGGEYQNSLLGDTITLNDGSNLHTLSANDMPFVQGSVWVEIAGVMTKVCSLSSFTQKFDRGIEAKALLCDKKSVKVTKADVSGEFEGEFAKEFYQAVFSKDNSKSVKTEVRFASGTNTLVYTMDEVTFSFKAEPVTYGEAMLIKGSWSASKKSGSTEKLKVVLTNGVADYNL